MAGRKSDGQWNLSIKNAEHNHPPSGYMSGHPTYRQLNEQNMQIVRSMSSAGISPRQMLATLSQNNDTFTAISKTIYNPQMQIRHENLQGRTPIQSLIDELTKGD